MPKKAPRKAAKRSSSRVKDDPLSHRYCDAIEAFREHCAERGLNFREEVAILIERHLGDE